MKNINVSRSVYSIVLACSRKIYCKILIFKHFDNLLVIFRDQQECTCTNLTKVSGNIVQQTLVEKCRRARRIREFFKVKYDL